MQTHQATYQFIFLLIVDLRKNSVFTGCVFLPWNVYS
jgi:hypothetical protein